MIGVEVETHEKSRLADLAFMPGQFHGADKGIVDEKTISTDKGVEKRFEPVIQVGVLVRLPTNPRHSVPVDREGDLGVNYVAEAAKSLGKDVVEDLARTCL
jgi:hypothetical protein